MSTIAKKKMLQKKGPETILIYMGTILLIISLGVFLITMLEWIKSAAYSLAPALALLAIGGLSIGIGVQIRANEDYTIKLKEWFVSAILICVIAAGLLAAYKW